ncbi:ABC transporter substrate-binding protein [Halomonas sp. CUBES01]|uniref:ABC transporter substrate-binding protein n=1 Tax=Vreelandella gomseomensis TaxID=370766 RepID=A0ABU1G8U9_9GAMM|nr:MULTISPECIES: ABC transporter substrate-binding protein [Halomonas]MDR5873405.1 ABC transporter substrate-binding protein [Halomonas gomseomensis]MEC4768164.1 ABC transporter substrate-binding protein [Halomonas sp. CUBES01]
MALLYPQNTGMILAYQKKTLDRSVRHKSMALLIALLISFLMSNASTASDENHIAPLATFDFAIAETLNAIGHPPKFLSGLEGYETYSRQEGVLPHATNLGYRHLPNLELLASDPPQHILISPPAHVSLLPRLRKIADVMEYPLYKYADADGPNNDWETIKEMTRQLGDLVEEPDAAEHYIEQASRHFTSLKQALTDIDSPLLVVRLMDERHARVYGEGSVEGMMLNRLGLENAWQGDLGRWGMTTVGATSLFDIDAKLVFLDSPYGPDGGVRQLLSDGQWRHLPAVKQGRYTIIPVNYWSWGGLPAARRFGDNLVSRLTETENIDSAYADTSR